MWTPLKPLPENCTSIREEMETLYRELPRLLAEGHEGKFALIQGKDVVGIWDDYEHATEAVYDRFGIDVQFIAQPVDRRDLDRLAPYFGPIEQVIA